MIPNNVFFQILETETDSEARFRSLVAVGTLVSEKASNRLLKLTRTYENDSECYFVPRWCSEKILTLLRILCSTTEKKC